MHCRRSTTRVLFLLTWGVLMSLGPIACHRTPNGTTPGTPSSEFPDPLTASPAAPPGATEDQLVLGGGCFWCVEAVYGHLRGVRAVTSGYAGGTAESANYPAVCQGDTDHAEVVQILFDPHHISRGTLLKVFFATAHDPTQLNRQGADVGRQYRSVIFWQRPEERDFAAAYIDQLNRAGVFAQPIVTTLEPLTTFYPAEPYHQDYARRNPDQPYIRMVSAPKVEKTRQTFTDLMP